MNTILSHIPERSRDVSLGGSLNADGALGASITRGMFLKVMEDKLKGAVRANM